MIPKWLTAELLVKLGLGLILIGGGWVRFESALKSFNERLDRIEANQQGYVRADLAQARNETLGAKLDGVTLRLDRIEMKIDYQDDRSTRSH